MSITSTSTPGTQTPVFRDVTVAGYTDRKKSTETELSITAAASGGTGYTDLTISLAGSILDSKDIIKITGSTYYDGVYAVSSLPDANTVRIEFDFVATDTGTCVRYNENFSFKFEILDNEVTPSVLITKYFYPTWDSSGRAAYSLNINAILRDLIDENDCLLWDRVATIADIEAGVLEYKYRVTEVYNDENGLSVEGDSDTEPSTNVYRAYNVFHTDDGVTLRPHLCDGSGSCEDKFCTNRPDFVMSPTDAIFFDAIIGSGYSYVTARIDRTDAGTGGGGPGEGDTVTNVYIPASASHPVPDSQKIGFVLNDNSIGFRSGTYKAEVYLMGSADGETWETISDTYTITVDSAKCNQENIVFKNFAGGWDVLRVENTKEKVFNVDRERAELDGERGTYYAEGLQQRTLTTDWLTPDQLEWLKELMLSKDVYLVVDGDLERINIENKTMIVHKFRELVKMSLKISEQRITDFRHG